MKALQLEIRAAPARTDPIHITGGAIEDGFLELDVRHGAAPTHSYELIWSGRFGERPATPISFVLLHHANGDVDEELVVRTLRFDLSSVRDAFRRAHDLQHGQIRIDVLGCPTQFKYRF